MTMLKLKLEADIQEGTFLRPRDPSNREQFNEILPWMTPLFCYRMNDKMWVRWAAPLMVAQKLGMTDAKCGCCGKEVTVEEDGDYVVDTAWHETDWWLEANGYRLPEQPALPNPNPTIQGENT